MADYPEYSIQEWADLIRNNTVCKGKNPVFPISILWGMALIGDLLKIFGWSDPPLTKFRLKNILTGAHYPVGKTQEIVGQLPNSLNDGVLKTLSWMYKEKIIRTKK